MQLKSNKNGIISHTDILMQCKRYAEMGEHLGRLEILKRRKLENLIKGINELNKKLVFLPLLKNGEF